MPYFDHNATTPLAPVAREAWLRASDEAWQNPSSPYRSAARVKIRLDAARERLAELVSAKPAELVFTSGATEGAHAVMADWARTLPPGARVAVNPTEHPCVLSAVERFFSGRIIWLALTKAGVVREEKLDGLLSSRAVAGVIAMAANNETGVIQPWSEIAQRCRRAGVIYFCDASQWLGKLPASGLGAVDWVIGAAHKFGGPKGVGLLKVPADATGFRLQPGGEQEGGRRGGTENFPGVAAMVAALADAEQKKMFLETERLRWRDEFERSVAAAIPGVRVVGGEAERLWNTVSLMLPHTENHRWVARLDKRDFQVSTGSACATGKAGPSHVLAALGYAADEASRVIRISSGWDATPEVWRELATALVEVEGELRTNGAATNVVKL